MPESSISCENIKKIWRNTCWLQLITLKSSYRPILIIVFVLIVRRISWTVILEYLGQLNIESLKLSSKRGVLSVIFNQRKVKWNDIGLNQLIIDPTCTRLTFIPSTIVDLFYPNYFHSRLIRNCRAGRFVCFFCIVLFCFVLFLFCCCCFFFSILQSCSLIWNPLANLTVTWTPSSIILPKRSIRVE